jgi:hypothetical protein
MAVGRAPAQRFVRLDPGGRPGSSHLLAVCPSPEPVTVRGSVKRNELDIRTALKHPTDQGKVAARGPQTGPRGHVSVPTVEEQNRRDPHSHDDSLRGFIEAVGPRAEALDSNFRGWAGPCKPAAHGPNVNLEQCGGVSPRVASDGTWSVTVPQPALLSSALADGSYPVKADLSDQYGNSATGGLAPLTPGRRPRPAARSRAR